MTNCKHCIKSLVGDARVQYWLFTFALLLPALLMTFTEGHAWYVAVLQLLFATGLFGGLMSLGRRPGRQIFVLFLFVFFAAFQLVLLYLYGSAPISVDMFLNLVSTNANEAGELLGNIIMGVIWVCGFYIVVLWLAVVSWRRDIELEREWQRGIRRRVMLPLVVISTAVSLVLQQFGAMRLHEHVYPVNVSYNAGMAVYRYVQLKCYDGNAEGFTFGATATHDSDEQETYVLVIGETARNMNFALYGYERDTNPRLAGRDGLLVYTDVMSESNTTHKSVPLIVTAAEAADPSPMYSERSLITAFKEAGFYTIYISNQADNGALIDHYSREADVRLYVRTDGQLPDDADILRALSEQLQGDTHAKRLIVVHAYGSHFKYCERVPADYRRFRPCDDKQLSAANREHLINAYDNTILYTDMVVDSLITIVQAMPADTARHHSAMLIYTSDHGEDIYDDEHEYFLHASPIVTRYQLAVPFIAWVSDDYASAHPSEAGAMVSHTATHVAPGRVVFHTMLSAAGIECARLDRTHALCDTAYTAPAHLFLNDRNEAIMIDATRLP